MYTSIFRLLARYGKGSQSRNFEEDKLGLEEKLDGLGFDTFNLTDAIRTFQKVVGLKVTGEVESMDETHKWLGSENAPKFVRLTKFGGMGSYILDWYLERLEKIHTEYKAHVKKHEPYAFLDGIMEVSTGISGSKDARFNTANKARVVFRYFNRSRDVRFIKRLFERFGLDANFDEAYGSLVADVLKLEDTPDMGSTEAQETKSDNKPPPAEESTGGNETSAPPPKSSERKTQEGDPKWVEIAKRELGVKEIVGDKHEPRVIEYHSATGGFKTDEIPWCASFCTWVVKKAGLSSTGLNAAARSFASASSMERIDKPYYGCIVVFKYNDKKNWSGHVGIVTDIVNGKYKVLGGNQSNSVKYSYFGKGKVYGLYWPKGQPLTYVLGNKSSSANTKETDYKSTR